MYVALTQFVSCVCVRTWRGQIGLGDIVSLTKPWKKLNVGDLLGGDSAALDFAVKVGSVSALPACLLTSSPPFFQLPGVQCMTAVARPLYPPAVMPSQLLRIPKRAR